MQKEINEKLKQIKQSSLYRRLPHEAQGEELFTPATNDYLGLARDQRVKKAAQEAIAIYGTGSTGSRLTTGKNVLHERLEKELASFKGYEACLLYSSGYLANIGVITAIADKQTVIFSDQYNHASLIDGCRLSKARIVIYKHNDMNDLERKLIRFEQTNKKIILTDGVFSMDGDVAPLDQLDYLAKRYHSLLVVDDAHGTGVLGESGRGSTEYFGLQPDILIGTLSKAFGSEGGFVCAKETFVDYFIQRSRPFIFQTALSPANVAAALMSLHIIQTEKRHQALKKQASKLRKTLGDLYTIPETACITPIVPLIIGSNEAALQLQTQLYKYGIHIPAIRPPTVPEGMSRLRCTLSSNYPEEKIDYLIHTLTILAKDAERS